MFGVLFNYSRYRFRVVKTQKIRKKNGQIARIKTIRTEKQ